MEDGLKKIAEVALTTASKKALELGFDKLRAVLSRTKTQLSTPSSEIEEAISKHQIEIKTWANDVSFTETPLGRRLTDVFVPLNIYVTRRRSLVEDQAIPDLELETVLSSDGGHFIILGQPGAGKTTALKHICSRFLEDPDFLSKYQIIIRLQLRELNLTSPSTVPEYIRRWLEETLRLRISFPNELSSEEHAGARRSIRDSVITDWLNTVQALFILDGFDEVTLKQRRDFIVEELRRLALQLTTSAFIMTTRSGEFSAHVDRVRAVEIRPFSGSQINAFAASWLGADDAPRFLAQLEQSPYHDTAMRPLTLAHLCVIFEKSKRIPSKPRTIYRKIVRLLLEDWDAAKSVVRESAYAGFEPDRKEEFLANLAYELTRQYKTTTFTTEGLRRCYESIHDNFGLPLNQASKVVDELETHTGLFFQSAQNSFEFSHKSLQEFLAAEFIVRLPSIPSNMIELQIMPTELAVATAISSQPSEYLTQLISEHFNRIRTSFQFTRSFVNRLLLEDPDFEEAPRVGYALLVLYSQYLRAVIHLDQQLSLFVKDQLGREFELLGKKIRQRVTLSELDDVFHRVESTYTFEGEIVWRLNRKDTKQKRLRRADMSILPDELYLKESLLAKQESLTPVDIDLNQSGAPLIKVAS